MSRLSDLKAAVDAAPHKPRRLDAVSWPTRGLIAVGVLLALLPLGYLAIKGFHALWPPFDAGDQAVIAIPLETHYRVPLALTDQDCGIVVSCGPVRPR